MIDDYPDNRTTLNFKSRSGPNAELDLNGSNRAQGRDPVLEFLSGRLGPTEEQHVSTIINRTPLAARVINQYLASVAASAEEIPDAALELKELRANIDRLAEREGDSVKQRRLSAREKSPSRSLYYYAAAASILLLVIVSTYIFDSGQFAFTGAPETSIYTTANAQRASITLTDGSSITLNVGGRVEVPETYGKTDRTVYLTGEALFTVNGSQGAPFTVVTRQGEARVLGTTFVVRSYNTDTTMTVAVQDGKVSLGGDLVLAEGEQAVIGLSGGVVRVGDLTPGIFTFANGVLTLDEMLLLQALPTLSRWYGARVTLGDISLTSRTIGGEFVAGSILDFKMLLETILDVRVERHGKVLTLFPRDK